MVQPLKDPPPPPTEASAVDIDGGIAAALAGVQARVGSRDAAGGPTDGQTVSPEEAEYYQHIRIVVSGHWLAPAVTGSADLVATYKIVIEPDGRVSSSLLVKSSGSDAYDLSVERALKESSPFRPLPPVFGEKAVSLRLNFKLSDLRAGV